MRDRRY
jgi:hypothetical protein